MPQGPLPVAQPEPPKNARSNPAAAAAAQRQLAPPPGAGVVSPRAHPDYDPDGGGVDEGRLRDDEGPDGGSAMAAARERLIREYRYPEDDPIFAMIDVLEYLEREVARIMAKTDLSNRAWLREFGRWVEQVEDVLGDSDYLVDALREVRDGVADLRQDLGERGGEIKRWMEQASALQSDMKLAVSRIAETGMVRRVANILLPGVYVGLGVVLGVMVSALWMWLASR